MRQQSCRPEGPGQRTDQEGGRGTSGVSDGTRPRVRDVNGLKVSVCVQALAIVMDTFSDVELLCDLLEASRKRNVSVYLLLDRLNLKPFVSMWQELKLDSNDFPVSLLLHPPCSYCCSEFIPEKPQMWHICV